MCPPEVDPKKTQRVGPCVVGRGLVRVGSKGLVWSSMIRVNIYFTSKKSAAVLAEASSNLSFVTRRSSMKITSSPLRNVVQDNSLL